MGGVDFGIDTKQVGNIGGFNEALIEQLLTIIVEFV
jgi:hypothetical protein